MKKLIFLSLSFISINVFAQKSDTISYYTDVDFNPVAKEKAKNIFKLYQSDANSWTFLRYDVKNGLQVKETYADALLTRKHGVYVAYKLGKPSLKGRYFDNLRHGDFISYDTSGIVEDVSFYNLDTLKTNVVYWRSGGKRQKITYGTKMQIAERQVYYENGNLAIKQKYSSDNKLIDSAYLGTDGNLVKILEIETPPNFPGGLKRFYEYIGRRLKYPTNAAQQNIQGTVSVSFTITETGKLTDITINRSVYPSIDREAERVISMSPRWEPGKLFGENIRVKYTIPIGFSLSN